MYWNSVRWGKEYFALGRLDHPGQKKNICTNTTSPTYQQGKTLSPFTVVSTVGKGHPSLVSLQWTVHSANGIWLFLINLFLISSGGQNDDFRPLTYTLGGEGHGVQGQICGILRPQLAMNSFLPLWPHRFPHFGYIHLGGEGVGGLWY